MAHHGIASPAVGIATSNSHARTPTRTTTGAVPTFNKQLRLSKTGFSDSKPETRSFALNKAAEALSTSTRCPLLYNHALKLARSQVCPTFEWARIRAIFKDYEAARQAFQECVLSCPSNAKAWISWAQMEKRTKSAIANDHVKRCREVLQRGLMANPDSASLCQSWGLLELQRGNMHAAVRLLERCVLQDPSCSPVLKWKAVQLAQQVVLSRRQRLAMRTANFV